MPIAGLISSELVATPSVCPSGGAFATAVVIRMVPAPGRFSTSTVLPPQRAERQIGENARHHVGRPAGRERHQQPHGAGRKFLRVRAAREQSQRAGD